MRSGGVARTHPEDSEDNAAADVTKGHRRPEAKNQRGSGLYTMELTTEPQIQNSRPRCQMEDAYSTF